jgi:hypothetical protein
MNRFVEIVQSISHALHVTKPVLFELVLFIWAITEMVKFLWQVVLGPG